jgi:hypothetical protein
MQLVSGKVVHKGVNEFIHVPFFKPIWVKFDTGSLHIIPLRICEFRENR